MGKMQPDGMKKIIDSYIQSYNSFDIDGMIAHAHQDMLFQNVSDGKVTMTIRGLTDFRSAAEKVRGLFKSRCQKIEKYEFGVDTARVEIDYEGVLAADIPDGPKAGETIRLKGISEFEFKDGLVIKFIDYS